jgi:endonuclease/exonuclease/phosphatase family metal-dependent hydrolase
MAPAPPASAATVDATYRVWTWNIAGWAIHGGSTTDGLIPVLANSIRNRDAQFAAVNELCHNQYDAIRRNLRNSGWMQDPNNFARFTTTRSGRCNGEDVGIALFSKAPLGSVNRFTLPDDGRPEARKLMCAPLLNRPHLRFCTTHITTSNEVINGEKINKQQLDYVRARLEDYHAAGDTVIIAGDFNAQPDYGRLNGWYSSSLDVPNNRNNTGRYRELDDTDSRCPGYGERTQADTTGGPCGLGVKIDLIFVRENTIVGSYSGDSLAISSACGGPCSNHRIVTGTVTVRVNV